jgi:hypothetical protein
MEFRLSGASIQFSGVLDERTSMTGVRDVVERALASSSDGVVSLNFGEVKRANSLGILAWAKFIEASDYRFSYVEAPEWLVEQFNLCGLLKQGSSVESLQAPFYCPDDDSHETITLVIGRDVPIQSDYSTLEILRKTAEGLTLEPDFDPPEFLNFLARDAQRRAGGK